jgi:hypothetical protein
LVKYGNSDITTQGMNLSRFELTSISFQTLLAMPSITNLKATISSLASVFYTDWRYTNSVMTTITGTITITGTGGAISQAWYGYKNLIFNFGNGLYIELADGAKLTGSAYRAICNCPKFTYNDLVYVMSKLGNASTFQEAFYADTGITTTTLPATLFCGTSGSGYTHPATSVENMFGGCSGMKNLVLPSGIFDPLKNVTTMSNWCWSGSVTVRNPYVSSNVSISDGTTTVNKSNIAGTIPAKLFDSMSKLQYLNNFFAGSTITIADINTLFVNATNLVYLQNVFAGATLTLTTSPTKAMFAGLTKVTSVYGLFRNTNIKFNNGVVPTEFFSNLTALNNVSYVFCGCSNITSLGDGTLISKNSKLVSLNFMLSRTGLVGTIPENFLPADGSSTRDLSGVFFGCTSLGNYSDQVEAGEFSNDIPADIFKGQTHVTSIAYMFGNCTNLSIDLDTGSYWFEDLRKLTNVSGLFYNDLGLHGAIPDYGYVEELSDFYEVAKDEKGNILYDENDDTKIIMNYIGNSKRTNGFFTCKDSNGEVIDSPIIYAAYVFYQCFNLNGAVPGNLLSKMTNVINLSYMFYYCKRLNTLSDSTVHGTSIIQVNNRHMPYGLLDDCVAVTTLAYMFAYCRFNGKSSEKATADLDDTTYDENYALPKYFFRFCTELINIQAMFVRDWTSSVTTEENEDRYISEMYGAIYPFMFMYNTKLTTITSLFSYCNNIKGYATATSENGIDYNLFSTTKYIAYMASAFYATGVGMVERGLILQRNQIAAIKAVSSIFSPGILSANYGSTGSPVGKQMVYDINTNTYKSFFDAYGIYAVDANSGY